MSAVSFLISDPSPALQTFLHLVLTGYGFDAANIKSAGNPHAAAEMASSLKPDVLITDWFAKESITGIDLHSLVVQHNSQCRLALLVLGITPAHEHEARAAQALFLLAKPFSADVARAEMARALEQLAKGHPQIAHQLATRAVATERARVPTIQLPSLPHYKPGDRVVYRDRTEQVQHVILRRGEMMVQLQGVSGLVAVDQVHPR